VTKAERIQFTANGSIRISSGFQEKKASTFQELGTRAYIGYMEKPD